jgi:hypothetical protein
LWKFNADDFIDTQKNKFDLAQINVLVFNICITSYKKNRQTILSKILGTVFIKIQYLFYKAKPNKLNRQK